MEFPALFVQVVLYLLNPQDEISYSAHMGGGDDWGFGLDWFHLGCGWVGDPGIPVRYHLSLFVPGAVAGLLLVLVFGRNLTIKTYAIEQEAR